MVAFAKGDDALDYVGGSDPAASHIDLIIINCDAPGTLSFVTELRRKCAVLGFSPVIAGYSLGRVTAADASPIHDVLDQVPALVESSCALDFFFGGGADGEDDSHC